MHKIVIEGGHRLEGEVLISGAKNAALPILISSLLAEGKSTYTNVPILKDIDSVKQLLASLGAVVETDGHTVSIDVSGLCTPEADYDLVRKMRASILVLGPLVARLKRAKVSLPGGCAIGARPIDQHLAGLKRLGATISLNHGYVEATAEKLVGADIYFDMVTVTGTENLMMAAALAEGVTTLRNAAKEPEVTALADALNRMGAKIQGAGSPVITICGVPKLSPATVSIIPDRIEAGTFMVAAALTGGDITLRKVDPTHLEAVVDKLRLAGANVTVGTDTIRVRGGRKIKSIDIKTLPYPGFPTDMQAQFMVLMAVGGGLSLISETIFENRFIHVSELQRMGADIAISGHAAMVKGAKALSGAPVMASDLRASACLILAGLVAKGTTEVNRIYHLDRGYEALEEKFAKLGAVIERVPV